MKKVFEGIRDLLYDYIDTILVIGIVVLVSGTIMWRLDILFASDLENETLEPIEVISEEKEDVSENNSDNDDKNEKMDTEENDNENGKKDTSDENEVDSEEKEDTPKDDTASNDNNDEDKKEPQEVETFTVEIPSGSLGPTIGDILIKKGLIDDKWEFLRRAQELGLDTKLKSGTFKIKSDSSLDIIIKTISRNL